MKFSSDRFDIEKIISETEKQRKLHKIRIAEYFECHESRAQKYVLNMRLIRNSVFSRWYKQYFDDNLGCEIDDYIYFKDYKIKKR